MSQIIYIYNLAMSKTNGPLSNIRVLDCATLFAGPLTGALLGDYGADVIKIEHPSKPDAARSHGATKNSQTSDWWTVVGRNKRTVTLDLRAESGAKIFRKLAESADVIISNFRPGTLESWNLGYEQLAEINPGLVLAHLSGFGRIGPRAQEAGFGTLAEAMSGFASMTGQPDGPPTLPPFALGDGVAGIMTAYAVMVALHARNDTGRGQEIDVSLVEPLLNILGPQVTTYSRTGKKPQRIGNRSTNNAPRNLYKTKDGRWLAISTSATSIAERVMKLVGAEEVISEDWFSTAAGRVEHGDYLDSLVADWILERDSDEALQSFRRAGAAATLVYDVEDILSDSQLEALGTIKELPDNDGKNIKVLNVPFRMSSTPGEIRFTGRGHGQDNASVFSEVGVTASELQKLKSEGVI